IEDKETYLPPKVLAMHLNHKHVNLGYFEFIQHRIRNVVSGDVLIIREEGCANSKGELVLKFSKNLIETLQMQEKNGYILKGAKVNFVIYWMNEETGKEVKIILPDL